MYGAAGVYGFTNILSIVQQNMFPHDVLELMMLQIKYLQTMIDEAIFELEYDISIYGKTITDLGKKINQPVVANHMQLMIVLVIVMIIILLKQVNLLVLVIVIIIILLKQVNLLILLLQPFLNLL